MKRPRELTIAPVLNGYVVRVGCQVVVFTTREGLLTELDGYLKDPRGYEEKFVKLALHGEPELNIGNAGGAVATNQVAQEAINRPQVAYPPEPQAPSSVLGGLFNR
jgi:hypothetical protein